MILLLRIDKSLMNCCQKCCRIEQSLISLSIRRFILLRLAKFGTSIRQPVRTELLPHGQPDKFANHYPMPRHQTLNIHFITFCLVLMQDFKYGALSVNISWIICWNLVQKCKNHWFKKENFFFFWKLKLNIFKALCKKWIQLLVNKTK